MLVVDSSVWIDFFNGARAPRQVHRVHQAHQADQLDQLLGHGEIRIVVPDLEAYERFVMDFTKIPGIAQIRSSFALRPVKQGTVLPLG